MTLLNLPKYVSKTDLKKQYHKLAKLYHPDVQRSGVTLSEKDQKRIEEKFKSFNQAYERLQKWIDERELRFEESLRSGSHPSGIRVDDSSSEQTTEQQVTQTIGKLVVRGKMSQIDK